MKPFRAVISLLALAVMLQLPVLAESSLPRVLFDEAHDEINTISETRARQINSAHPEFYYFGSLADPVSVDYGLERGVTPFDSAYLAGFDVVVLSTPRGAFQQQELDALKAFVERGGGLLVLQDAGPSPTMGSNQVARLFGASFRSGALLSRNGDWDAGSFQVDEADPQHPIMLFCDGLQMNWGCSIVETADCDVLLASKADTWQDANGNQRADAGEPGGPLPVAVALEVGNGRVVLVGDNALHNNLWSRNQTLFFNALRWLSAGAATDNSPASYSFAVEAGISRESVEETSDGQQVVSQEVRFYPNSRHILPGGTIYWTVDLGDLEGPFTIVPELDNDNDPEPWMQTNEHLLAVPFTYETANVYVPFLSVTDGAGMTRKVYSSEVVAVMPELAPRAGLGLKLPTPTDPTGDYIKGMNVFTFDYTLFDSEDGRQFVQGELDRIAALGCNMVIFNVAWFNDNETSSIQEPIYGSAWPACWVGTLPVEDLVELADWCHSRALRVCFRYFLRQKGDHSGAARAYYSPANSELYMAQQTDIKVEYARLCDALGVELFCLDAENQYFTRAAGVSSLIRDMRAVYRGAITNGAWDALANYGCPYASELDVLSWSDYYLTSVDFGLSASAEQLAENYLLHCRNDVEPLLVHFGKPGLAIETGVNIRETGASQVARLYTAYLDAFTHLQKVSAPLCGNAWWVWNLSDPQVEPHAMRGYPAEGILSACFNGDLSETIVADFTRAQTTPPSVGLLLEGFERGMPVYEMWQQASSIAAQVEACGSSNDHCLAVRLSPTAGDADNRFGFVWTALTKPSDWSRFSSFNFWLKSAAPNWGVEVDVCDSDGDRFNIRVETQPFLATTLPETGGWHLVTIPFALFTKPSWDTGGNGALDWRKIARFGFGLLYQNHGAQTIWLDDIYLSREGALP